MNHKEPILLTTLSDEYQKHSVPKVVVHRASGGNHDQCKSINSIKVYRITTLNQPATPPRRSVQRSYRNQRARDSQGRSQRIERPIDVGALFHWPRSLHPSESSPGIPLAHPQKDRLFNFRLKYAINPICRFADHPDAVVS